MAVSIRFILSVVTAVALVNLSFAFSPTLVTLHQPMRRNLATFAVATATSGATTIERQTVQITTRPATVGRPTEEIQREKAPVKERQGQGNESWEVRIYNDTLNTREHVARCLVQVTGLSEFMAYKTMMLAHNHGMAVVGRYAFEIAEMYHDQLKKQGLVCDLVPVDEH